MKTVLHIVNQNANGSEAFNRQLQLMTAGDGVVFIEDGVYNCLKNAANHALLENIKASSFVLRPDLLARGFEQQNVIHDVQAIDYDGFVELAARFEVSQSW